MPASVKDEATWEKAKDAFKKSYPDRGAPESDSDYAIVMTIYKNMGGKTSSLARMLEDTRKALRQQANKHRSGTQKLEDGLVRLLGDMINR